MKVKSIKADFTFILPLSNDKFHLRNHDKVVFLIQILSLLLQGFHRMGFKNLVNLGSIFIDSIDEEVLEHLVSLYICQLFDLLVQNVNH